MTCKHGPGILQGGLLPTGELMQGLLGALVNLLAWSPSLLLLLLPLLQL